MTGGMITDSVGTQERTIGWCSEIEKCLYRANSRPTIGWIVVRNDAAPVLRHVGIP